MVDLENYLKQVRFLRYLCTSQDRTTKMPAPRPGLTLCTVSSELFKKHLGYE